MFVVYSIFNVSTIHFFVGVILFLSVIFKVKQVFV